MVNRINYGQISSRFKRTFILDTNIWIYLYGPYSEKDYGYSKILDQLLKNNCKILLPPIVSTEFVNRLCRQAFEIYKDGQKDLFYKRDFRPTPAYDIAFNLAIGILNEDILPITEFVSLEEADLSKSTKTPILADLNDDIILNIANRTNSVLVTHDRDFNKSNSNTEVFQL